MNNSGFSLMEVKVCCAILAILTAVGYPFAAKLNRQCTLNYEMRQLLSNANLAKMEAIKRNSNVAIKIEEEGYRVFIDDGACGGIKKDYVQQGCEKRLVHYTFKEGIAVADTSFSANRFGFNGRVGSKAGSITLHNEMGDKIRMVINLVGRIRVEKI